MCGCCFFILFSCSGFYRFRLFMFRVLQIPAFRVPDFTDSGFSCSGFYRFRLFMFRVLPIPAFHVPGFTDSGFSCSGFYRFRLFMFRVLQVPAFHVPGFLVPCSVPRSGPRFPVPCFTDSRCTPKHENLSRLAAFLRLQLVCCNLLLRNLA